MQLYNWKWQKPKWKDIKTFNDKTQVQANAKEVRAKKSMEPRWSPTFGLDELDVWHECWWQIKLRLVNWHPHVGQKTLGGGYECIEKMG
jgi:hypothetical protein